MQFCTPITGSGHAFRSVFGDLSVQVGVGQVGDKAIDKSHDVQHSQIGLETEQQSGDNQGDIDSDKIKFRAEVKFFNNKTGDPGNR